MRRHAAFCEAHCVQTLKGHFMNDRLLLLAWTNKLPAAVL